MIIRICILCLLIWSSLSQAQSYQPYTVSTQSSEYSVLKQGVWLPIRWHVLHAPEKALVISVHAHYGQRINQGDMIVQLDDEQVTLDVQKAEMSVLEQARKINQIENWYQSHTY